MLAEGLEWHLLLPALFAIITSGEVPNAISFFLQIIAYISALVAPYGGLVAGTHFTSDRVCLPDAMGILVR
jgi:hypothetical protein